MAVWGEICGGPVAQGHSILEGAPSATKNTSYVTFLITMHPAKSYGLLGINAKLPIT